MDVLPGNVHRIRVLEIAVIVQRLEIRHRLVQGVIKGISGVVERRPCHKEGLVLTGIPLDRVIICKDIVQLDAHLVCRKLTALVG